MVPLSKPRAACYLLASVLLSGVAGCSAGAQPSGDPTTTPRVNLTRTPTTSETKTAAPTPPSRTEPELPAAAKAPTRSGAEAFVRYYIDLLNYAANTGDTKALRAAATDCPGCDRYADLYKSTYQEGGYFRDPGWTPFGVLSRRQAGAVTVLLHVNAPAVVSVMHKGAAPHRGHADVYSLRFDVERHNPTWTVTSFSGR